MGFERSGTWSGLARAALLCGIAAVAAAQQGARAPLLITGITPSGTNVPAGRQIVIQFSRRVVPVGRMDRTAAEIPIEITPPLACQWRWLDTSALACQLGDGEQFTLATRYTLVVGEGFAAEDGATTAGVRRHEFTTQRPRVSYPGFATWRSPGMPVLRVVFTQSVSEPSVREHLFMRHDGAARVPVEVAADGELRELPQYIRLPGERVFVDFGGRHDERLSTICRRRSAARPHGACGSCVRAPSCRSIHALRSSSSPVSSRPRAASSATRAASRSSSTRFRSSRSSVCIAATSTPAS